MDQYNAQLVAGHSKNTPDHGLIVFMPDYRRTPPLLGNLLCAVVHLLDQNPLNAAIENLLSQINAILGAL